MSTDALHLDAPVNTVSNPVFQLFRWYAGPHRRLLAFAICASLAYPVLAILPVYFLHVAIDGVLLGDGPIGSLDWLMRTGMDDPTNQLLVIGALIATVALVAAALGLISTIAWGRFAQQVQHELRVDAFTAVQERGVAFVEDQQTGQLMSILSDDIAECNRLLERFVKDILETGARFVGVGLLLLILHWQLALLAIIVFPVIGAVARRFIRLVRPLYAQLRQRVGAFNAAVENAFAGIDVVVASAGEQFERDRIHDRSRDIYDAQWRVIIAQAGFFPTVGVLNWWTFAGLLMLGGYWYRFGPPLVFTQELSLGVLVAFLLYNQQLATPLAQASHLVDVYLEARAAVSRILILLPENTTPVERKHHETIELDGHVAMEGVRFTYLDETDPTLHDIDLTVRPGETVGIVGPTGSGKTTLLRVLLGFYEPESGHVRFDGQDLRALNHTAVRECVGYVPQTPYLFTGTVRENVVYPGRNVADKAVERALRRAQAWSFVRELPDGIHSQVGQGGARLSAGQCQRIAIARALLDDPTVLILDEATNNLDLATETALQRSLEQTASRRSTVAVAHRLASVRHADEIVVLDEGEIVERGTHEELVEHGGQYAGLWGAKIAIDD